LGDSATRCGLIGCDFAGEKLHPLLLVLALITVTLSLLLAIAQVTEKKLKREFEDYGPVKRVRIVTDKNGGYHQ
jgi:hypothetical protein